MNPDRLFDYLDGRLPEHQRRALEEELMSSAEARREFEVARRIHAATQGGRERTEVLDAIDADRPRGRTMARQVLLAALVLVALNVLLGLLYIAHHEATNPNRALLEQQNREQLQQALANAAATTLTPPPLGVTELKVTTEKDHLDAAAEEIVQLAKRFNGTATKGIPENGRVEILVEIPGSNAEQFHTTLANLALIKDAERNRAIAANDGEKASILVQVAEEK
jgi:hypothetical protein